MPVPQTDPVLLALSMTSPRDDWRGTLAKEILLYLEKAYRNGHAHAVHDAFEWCRKYRLPVPDWVRDAHAQCKEAEASGRPKPKISFSRPICSGLLKSKSQIAESR